MKRYVFCYGCSKDREREKWFCIIWRYKDLGYYKDKVDAIIALHENWTDMREYLYDYAIIERIGEGICSIPSEVQWFKWDDDKQGFYEIDEPNEVKMYTNFAIG